MVDVILAKRDGGRLSDEQIDWFIRAYTDGQVPDEQASALLMAILFRGLDPEELARWTAQMIATGTRADLSGLSKPTVDKHSTGGVGDKTSIALGPVVAACGVPFAKMSGRGLGHTGGTLDKLESIPGFAVELTAERFVRQVADVGMAIVGQTPDLVPADRRLYALRDVTATVEEVSLIAASIMSKKIAAGAGAILLDVKVGEGAFMKTQAQARLLAETMLELGRRAGRRVVCELTAMDQPLGRAVGNALEVREAVAMLRGAGPPDFTELVLGSAGRLLAMSDLGVDEHEGRRRAEAAVTSGEALAAYGRWIAAQGGDPDEGRLPRAPVIQPVPAVATGYVTELHGLGIGRAAVHLGAGRSRKEDPVDHATGVVCLAKCGDRVETGQPLAEVHARDRAGAAHAVAEVAACYAIGPEPPSARPLVLEIVA